MMRESNGPHYGGGRLRVIVVEGQRLVAELLAAALYSQHECRVVATTADGSAAIDLLSQHRPDVMLLDAALEARGAYAVLRRMRALKAAPRVVAIDGQFHAAHVRELLRLGVSGYHTRHDSLGAIAGAIRLAAAGESSFCAEAADRVVATPQGPRLAAACYGPIEMLTERELDVFLAIAQGATVRQCAEQLNLSTSTIDNHKTRVMRKLNVHRNVDLVRLAIREGLIPS